MFNRIFRKSTSCTTDDIKDVRGKISMEDDIILESGLSKSFTLGSRPPSTQPDMSKPGMSGGPEDLMTKPRTISMSRSTTSGMSSKGENGSTSTISGTNESSRSSTSGLSTKPMGSILKTSTTTHPETTLLSASGIPRVESTDSLDDDLMQNVVTDIYTSTLFSRSTLVLSKHSIEPTNRLKKDPADGHKMVLAIQRISETDNHLRTSLGKKHPTELLNEYIKLNNIQMVRDTLSDPRVEISPAISISATLGRTSILELLINHSNGFRSERRLNPHRNRSNTEDTFDDSFKSATKYTSGENLATAREGSGIYGQRLPAFLAAARNNRIDTVQYLLKIEVYQKSGAITSALKEAIKNDATDVAILLSEYITYEDKLYMAKLSAKKNNLKLMEHFINSGADNIDILLSITAARGFIMLTEQLLKKYKAYPRTALQYASENGQGELLMFLYRNYKLAD